MAYEELPFVDSLEMNNVVENSELRFDITTFEGFAQLSDWHPYRAPALENLAVVSETPTLMASGGLDPVTPISNAKGALKYLKNGYELTFLDESHRLLFNPCFFQITGKIFLMTLTANQV